MSMDEEGVHQTGVTDKLRLDEHVGLLVRSPVVVAALMTAHSGLSGTCR
jgi:hypothetical protein